MSPVPDPLRRHPLGNAGREPVEASGDAEFIVMDTTSKKFFGLSIGQAVIFVTQIIGIVWFAADVKSDVRMNTAAIAHTKEEVAQLKIDRERDQRENLLFLREMDKKLGEISQKVGILADRAKLPT